MGGNYFYSQLTEAKDGNLIPLCKNSVTGQEIALHSKYNPLREAEGFAAQIDESCLFFVILGIAGGYHIEKILEKNEKCRILAVEDSESSLAFLMKLPLVKKLSKQKRIYFTDIYHLKEMLLTHYKPAIHGNLTILPLRQWESVFSQEACQCKEAITQAIKLLAADFSVQSHFGKIWQKNIISNLSLAEKAKSFDEVCKKTDKMKTAAIIAAGPSLDNNIALLKKKRDSYYIIATDTAYSALTKQNIISDAVVSIDGQQVSHEHYMENLSQKTIFFFDLCANAASVRRAFSITKNIILTESGHPLAQYASLYTGKRTFPHLEAGSGTVTIAAASLAKKIGFKNIEFFGADFSYSGGRAYCKGTYLESQFCIKSNRLETAEKASTALIYRTPVIKKDDGKITTEILEAYRLSLSDYMNKKEVSENTDICKFNLNDFKSRYCNDLRSTFKSENEYDENTYAFTTLLPLCAKLGKDSCFLAYLKTLRYTERV